MEDKRTLLAFLVIGLILLAMPYYYELIGVSKPAPREEPEEFAEDRPPSAPSTAQPLSSPSQTERANPRLAGALPEPERPGLARATPGDVFDPRHVTVTTPLQRLVFSTEGGVLVSAQMTAYKRHDGAPVELLPEGGRALAVSISTEEPSGGWLDLQSVEFAPDRDVVRIDEDDEAVLRLRADLPSGQSVEKRFHFRGDRYGIAVHITAHGFGDDAIAGLHWRGGIGDAERDWHVDRDALRAMVYINESLTEQSAEEEEEQLEERGAVKWAGVRNKYFLCSIAPIGVDRSWVELSSKQVPAERYRFDHEHDPPDWWPHHDFSVSARLNAGSWESLLFVGPMDYEEIVGYNVELERAMDLGFPVVREISKLLLVLFVAAYEYVPNYGYVILLFAFVVKLLVYPLTHKSYESAARMQQLQPKITALRDKYKNDSQRLSRETMKLYKEEGVNPLGGCLPMVLQMPIFIALYQTLNSTIELRQAPFVLWIEDLSRPDQLDIAGFDLHVLPITMAAAMFFQSKMTMKDPKQAALVYIMPIVMVVFMWQFSSGLVLYWTAFNLLQIGQQVLTNHLKKSSTPQPVPRQPSAPK